MKHFLSTRFLLWIFSLANSFSFGQVSVMPVNLYIHDKTNLVSLTISNPQDYAREVKINFTFGYPDSDEQGTLRMRYDDTTARVAYGLEDHLRAFPRNFILQPGTQQTVRLQVLPMRHKPDGVYWTRVAVQSSQQTKDIETQPLAEGIGTRINYVFSQNIPVFYCKGLVSTGLEVLDVTTIRDTNQLIAIAKLKPTGNAPFNGSVTAVLRNAAGSVVAEQHNTVVVYFETLRRIEIPLPVEGLQSGRYSLELLYETRRRDIPVEDLVQAPSVKHQVGVTIEP